MHPDYDQILTFILKQAAPDKSSLLEAELEAKPLSCLLNRDEHLACLYCFPERREIVIGIVGVVRLWALSYAYLHIWDNLHNAIVKMPEGGEYEIEFGSDETELLNWAMLCELNATLKLLGEEQQFNENSWLRLLPDNAPAPLGKKSSNVAFTKRATRLWESALGFLLHHELAHIRRNHSFNEGDRAIEEERIADQDSAKWILSGLDQSQPDFIDRGFGVALALLWLAVTEVYTGPIPSKTHPAGFERLSLILEEFVPNPRHSIWAFTSAVLQIHLRSYEQHNLSKKSVYETPKEDVLFFLSVIKSG